MNDGFASEPVPAQGNLPLRPQSGVPDPAVQAGQMPVDGRRGEMHAFQMMPEGQHELVS